MKRGFYSRLAWTGIRKNKKLYTPYILTCTGMVMMFYIIAYLAESPLLLQMRGGSTMALVMSLGRFVIGIFALIFLFYTHSFLIRRRNKEFGLYNILGMNKGNISRILLWETLITAVIALFFGLWLGILFSKLAELTLLRIIQSDVTYSLSIAFAGIWQTGAVFAVIFLLLLLISLGRVRLSNPLSLLKSESTGEKPPKANWLLALAGLVILAAAYYLAVSIQEPITAIAWFFVAVVMVILATYLLFIAGSVAFCRILQGNRHYYYRPNHFVSVSSMVYRMKRNGAGLASICILSTMVLVMLSSTSCLFIGAEDALRQMYPHDLSIGLRFNTLADCNEENITVLRASIEDAAKEVMADKIEYTMAETSGLLEKNGNIILDSDTVDYYDYDDLRQIYILPLSDYNSLMDANETLEPGEVLLYSTGAKYPYSTISLNGGEAWTVKQAEAFRDDITSIMPVTIYYLFVPDFNEYVEPILPLVSEKGYQLAYFYHIISFNMDGDSDQQIQMRETMVERLSSFVTGGDNALDGVRGYSVNSFVTARDDFYSLYGSLFFLGIMLSIVFIFAAVLIIYYKQISEGYEDQTRFEIMQKVGMTKREIRRSINSQVLTVFFAPLVLAGLHLAFAFPLVWKIIQFLGITNLPLLILVNVGCFLVFGLFYAVVYKVTSEAYFGIVSGAKE